MDKNTFSEADLITLLMGISSIPDAIKGKDFINTQTKIQSFIPTERTVSTRVQTEQIKIEFSQWMGNRNLEPYLDIIKLALNENKFL